MKRHLRTLLQFVHDWVPLILCTIAACLSGCSVPADYWKRTGEPYQVVSIERVDVLPKFCAQHKAGCSYRNDDLKIARIYILKKLPPWEDACVEKHERKEADGWAHAVDARSDCDW